MKIFKPIILILIIGLTIGCKDLIRDYELDTNPDQLSNIKLLDYIEQGKDSTLTLYAEAIRYAGLTDEIAAGSRTRVVPTNNAIRAVLSKAGVAKISDLSVNVVRDLFSYLYMDGAFRSIELTIDQTIEGATGSGNILYLSRVATSADKYRMLVNNSTLLATEPIEVIRQDYLFMDGVAHVVDLFPISQKKVKPTDSIPDNVDYSLAKKDTIWVKEDSHTYFANKTANYDASINQLVSRTGQLRQTLFKFDLPPIAYLDELTSAKLNFFVNLINGSNFIPNCGIFAINNEWQAKTVNWNNMPAFGAQVSNGNLVLDWNGIDITGFIQKVYSAKEKQLSLGLQLLNGANVTSSSVQIRNMEANKGGFKAFISLMGGMPTALKLVGIKPLQLAGKTAAPLTKEHISFAADGGQYQYSDNNIIYSLHVLPANGTLTKYGLPMQLYTRFTQQELASGAIKYVRNQEGNDQIQLKVFDYIGGVYPEIASIPVM